MGLKIAAFILMALGAIINYGAGFIAKRTGLTDKISVKEAEEFSGEELEKYRMTKSIARIKTVGILIMLPGVILVFFAFR